MKSQHANEPLRQRSGIVRAGWRLAWARLWLRMKRRRRMSETDATDLAQRVRLSGEW
ncbi:MAG: hypothetical protein KIS62_11875 [Ramlibacter sp.]|nr:hypothetical protein [Ramlibacter sp.]